MTAAHLTQTYSEGNSFNYSISEGLTGKDSKTIGYTIELDSKTNLVITNLPDNATIGEVTIVQETGDADPEETPLKNLTVDANNELSIANISAHELGYQYTIPVTVSNTEYTIKVSPMSYINYVQSKSASDLNTAMSLNDENKAVHLQNAVLALYKYYKAERDYRGNDITNR